MRKAVWVSVIAIVILFAWWLFPRHAPEATPGTEPAPAAAVVPEYPVSPAPVPPPTAEPSPVPSPAPVPDPPGPGDEEPAPEGTLTVSGRVAFPDGKPASGVEIGISGTQNMTISDVDGRYELTGLPAGQVEIEVLGSGMERTVEAGDSNVDFTLRKHVIRVTFVDDTGNTLREGSCGYKGTLGETTWTGFAMLGDARSGLTAILPVGARLVYSGNAPGRMQVSGEYIVDGEPSLREIRVPLPPLGATGSLALHFTTDGGTVPRALVLSLFDLAGENLADFSGKSVELDEDGRAILQGIQPGRFVLRTETQGVLDQENFTVTTSTPVEVQAGKEGQVEVLLKSGGRVRLTVKDRTGTFQEPEFMRLLDDRGSHVSGLFYAPDEDGNWTNPPMSPGPAWLDHPLPPGRYRVEVFQFTPSREKKVIGSKEFLVTWRQLTDVEVILE